MTRSEVINKLVELGTTKEAIATRLGQAKQEGNVDEWFKKAQAGIERLEPKADLTVSLEEKEEPKKREGKWVSDDEEFSPGKDLVSDIGESAETFFRGMGETATFGQIELVSALVDKAIGTGFAAFTDLDMDQVDSIKDSFKQQKERQEYLDSEHKAVSFMGQLAAFMLPLGAAKLVMRGGRAAGAGLTGARAIMAEGTGAALTYAAGKGGAELLTGQKTGQEVLKDIALEGTLGAAGSAVLGGIGIGFNQVKGAASEKLSKMFVSKVLKNPEKYGEEAVTLVKSLDEASELLEKGVSRQEVTAKIKGAVEAARKQAREKINKLSQDSGALDESFDVVANQYLDTVEQVARKISGQLDDQNISFAQTKEYVGELGKTLYNSNRAMHKAFKATLDSGENSISKVNAKEVVDIGEESTQILQWLRQEKILDSKWNVIKEVLPKDMAGKSIKRLEAYVKTLKTGSQGKMKWRNGVSVKMMLGDLHDSMGQFQKPLAEAYDGISKKLISGDKSGKYKALNESYTRARKIVSSIRKQGSVRKSAQEGIHDDLFRKIETDTEIEAGIRSSNRTITDRVDELLNLDEMSLFTQEEGQMMKSFFNQVRQSVKARSANDVPKLQKRLQKLVELGSKTDDTELAKLITDMKDLYNLDALQRASSMPKVLKLALKDPFNSKVVANARKWLKTNGFQKQTQEFNKLLAKKAKAERLKKGFSSNNQALKTLKEGDLPDPLVRELELYSDFIPEFHKLLNEEKLLKLINDKDIRQAVFGGSEDAIGKIMVGLGYVSGKLPGGKALMLGAALVGASLKNPMHYAMVLKRAGIKQNQIAADKIAAQAAMRADYIRTNILPGLIQGVRNGGK